MPPRGAGAPSSGTAGWRELGFYVAEATYWVEYGPFRHVLHNFQVLGWMVVNGYAHYLVRRRGRSGSVRLLGIRVMGEPGL